MNIKISLPPINNCLKMGLFLLSLKVLLSFSTIDTFIPKFDLALSVVSVAFLTISILQKKFTIKSFAISMLIIALACYSSYLIKNTTLFITIITIFAIREEKDIIQFLMKYEILIVLVITLVFVSIHNIGLYNEIEQVYGFYYVFSHANVFACIIYNIITMWIWSNYERLTPKTLLIIAFIFVVTYFITYTKTVLLLGICTTILIYFSLKENQSINKLLSYIASAIIPVLSFVFYYLISYYDNTNRVITTLDNFLTGRIRLGAYAYYHFGSTWFGQYLEKNTIFGWDEYWQMSKFTTFDNMYTTFIVRYGIVWLVLLAIVFYLLAKKKNNLINCMLIIWAIYAITEAHIINGFLGFPILLAALLLERKQSENPKIML